MRPRDLRLGKRFNDVLIDYGREVRRLPGVQNSDNRTALVEQLLESVHRVRYISVIAERNISPHRVEPKSDLFDPLKAALLKERAGDHDEAFWLTFLSVHFGKHGRDGWLLTRQVYGRLGDRKIWSWANASADPTAFRRWVAQHGSEFTGRFGNHRKYATHADTDTGTGAVVESYIKWIRPPRTHQQFIAEMQEEHGTNRRELFGALYSSLDAVAYFGRMAKFDFLTMIGKLRLADIEPGSLYMNGATGPFQGACLLFGGNPKAKFSRANLDAWCVQLADQLGVGMQELEDALCNWQKSPDRFIPFRG